MNELAATEIAAASLLTGAHRRLDNPPKEIDMTCYRPERVYSTFELPLEMANTRMAALRNETRRSRVTDDRTADHPPSSAVRRLRHGIGHRLIALGSALVAERRPRTLAR